MLSFYDLWIYHQEQSFCFSFSYLDTFVGVLDGAEEEGAVDQRISVVHEHHFLAQNARHVRLLVGCE